MPHTPRPLPRFPRIDRSRPTPEDRRQVIAYLIEVDGRLLELLRTEEARARFTARHNAAYKKVRKRLGAVGTPALETAAPTTTSRRPRLELSTKRLLDIAATLRRLYAVALGDPTVAEHRQGHVGRPPMEPIRRAPVVRWTEPRPLIDYNALAEHGKALVEGRFTRSLLLALCQPHVLHGDRQVPLLELTHAHDALPAEVRARVEWQRLQLAEGVDPKTAMRLVAGTSTLSARDRKRLARWTNDAAESTAITVRNVGQRSAYRFLPLLQALTLLAFFRHRGAPLAQVGRRAWLDLLALVPAAADRGVHLVLHRRDAPRGVESASTQLALPLDSDRVRIDIVEPSSRTFVRFLEAFPEPIRVAREEGLDRYLQQKMPRDGFWEAAYPAEYAEVDSTPLDLLVAFPLREGSPGVPMRVYLTVVQDVYSRLIMGYYLWVEPVTSYSVRFALYHALRPAPEIGRIDVRLPEHLRADLGAEHIAAATQAFLATVGIRHAPCNPRSPNERIGERFMLTMKQRLSTLPGYTKHPGVKVERLLKHPEQLLPFREALGAVNAILRDYNTTRHATTGQAPLERWMTAPGRRALADEAMALALLRSEQTATLRPEGVRYNGVDYRGDLTLTEGRTLLDYVGRTVRLYLPPPPVDFLMVALTAERPGNHVPERILGTLYPPGGAPRVSTDEQVAPGVRTLQHVVATATRAADPLTRRPVRAIPPLAAAPHADPIVTPPALPAAGAATGAPMSAFAQRLAAARAARAAASARTLESIGDSTEFSIRDHEPDA